MVAMNLLYAVLCGITALVASWYAFAGFFRGIAGASKAFFFGGIALAGIWGVITFLARGKLGQ
jgi:hypothetical protein